ncbi:MAG: hypothetical protein LUC18_00070 [Porphyromonadaceae bacterium]|nr:hypothetical protein [Porphyromonadaceae bacterium]
MKLSELIAKAQEMQKEYGDLEVLGLDYHGEPDNTHGFSLTAYRTFKNSEMLVPSWHETKLPTVNRLAIMII